MTCTDLAAVIYMGLIVLVIYGIAWCAEKFLCSASPSEQAWNDCETELYRANRDVESREQLKNSSVSSF